MERSDTDWPATAGTIRGPLYRRGAPWRTDRLCGPDEPGQPLLVRGRVLSAGEGRPAAGAVLDVWQADRRGLYSLRSWNLRGRFRTGEDGAFGFASVLPGHYPLWIFTRPRHIHVIATHPDLASLTTQLYFQGDRYLRRDPWVKPPLVFPLELDRRDPGAGERLLLELDLVLQPARP